MQDRHIVQSFSLATADSLQDTHIVQSLILATFESLQDTHIVLQHLKVCRTHIEQSCFPLQKKLSYGIYDLRSALTN